LALHEVTELNHVILKSFKFVFLQF